MTFARVQIVTRPMPGHPVALIGAALSGAGHLLGLGTAWISLPEEADELYGRSGPVPDATILVGGAAVSASVRGVPLHRAMPGPVWYLSLAPWWHELRQHHGVRGYLVDAVGDDRLHVASGTRPFALPGAFDALVQPERVPRLCVVEPVSPYAGSQGLDPAAVIAEALPPLDAARRTAVLGAVTRALDGGTPVTAWADVLAEALGVPADALLDPPLLKLVAALDVWLQRARRVRVATSLQGLPVDFYGAGWSAALGRVPGFTYMGARADADLARITQFYAGVVVMPSPGPHPMSERLCTALVAGCPVIAPASSALADVVAHRDDVTGYDLAILDAGPGATAALARASARPTEPDLRLIAELSGSRALVDVLRPDVAARARQLTVPTQRTAVAVAR